MLPKLFIHPSLEAQKQAALKETGILKLSQSHPDLLWLEPKKEGGTFGVEEAKKIKEHFVLKPYSAPSKVAVLILADNLTNDAQNTLLKTLEEPPTNSILILTASSETNLLPTVLSRCQIVLLHEVKDQEQLLAEFKETIDGLLSSSCQRRFEIIEKVENKNQFLLALEAYFHQTLKDNPKSLIFTKLILQAKKWQSSNVNSRAILEYLMLNLD